jgi:hypothetical protein
MTGIQFLADQLKKYGASLEDFWDGLISESRR